MLISRVPDEDTGRKEVRAAESTTENSQDYHTASELFEIMASNLNLNPDEDESLTTRDLVLIYKNIDLGNKLLSNANDFKRKAPNQYVETIVYEDLDSDSELSEICSSEDIHNIMLINDERINLLTRTTSFENTLCQKFRDIDLRSSNTSVEYDGKFVFKHPCLKNQLPYLQKQLHTLNTNDLVRTELPITLLDYICCKRFEENYNFDMENIIRYVRHTIEQLKRISNGDYLTDKVRAKWREVDNNVKIKKGEITEAKKVLANTTSIPLYVERKVTGSTTKWDDLVHSSIDIRSLSKILENKIIVEVPKTLCGSYKLFSKCCNDNLIIRCKRAMQNDESPEESRVDVVVQLNRSKSGHVMSNINSIMILQKSDKNCLLPLLPYKSAETVNNPESSCEEKSNCNEKKVTDLNIEDDQQCTNVAKQRKLFERVAGSLNFRSISSAENDSNGPLSDTTYLRYQRDTSDTGYSGSSFSNSGDCLKKYNFVGSNSPFNILHTDDLCLNMQRLNITSLPEESTEEYSSCCNNKKRSPTRNRIKSPYENKSHVIEEKKRRKLLEVRQRREKNKLALSVTGCKVNKHKFPLPPQTASSVTKLSISNKSFYNSIYGDNMEQKPCKIKSRKDCMLEVSSNDSAKLSPGVQEFLKQKYINKSYYLDNAVTEMMYLDMKKSDNQDRCSETSSTNDIKMQVKLLSKLITPSAIAGEADITNTIESPARFMEENNKQNDSIKENALSPIVKHNNTPNNTPLASEAITSESELQEKDPKKASTTAEFRKNIDKIYELINKLGKSDGNDMKPCKSKFTAVERATYNDGAGETSTIQCSDSGTSVKHQLTSSNPSCFSFEKTPNVEETPIDNNLKGSPRVPASKVIISAKSQNSKVDNDKLKKDRKRVGSGGRQTNVENPLKAISQFLQEIDSVQRTRIKGMTEKTRKPEVSFADMKVDNRTVLRKGYRTEQHRTDQNIEKPAKFVPKERKVKIPIIMQPPIENRGTGTKTLKKKVVDIVDEMKEARGEAVRGPCKPNSRLNSLAQPRKVYIQAQIEEFQARYGKSIVTDRLQKLSGSQSGQTINPPKNISPKYGRRKNSPVSSLPKQSSNSQPAVLEKPIEATQQPNKKKNRCDIVIPIIPDEHCGDQSTHVSSADSLKTLKKKIAALDTPVNTSPTFSENEFLSNGKARVPFIPNEIELASLVSSVDASSTIGTKIHEMIDDIVPSPTVAQRSNVETKNKEINANLREEAPNEIFCEKCHTQKIPANEKYSGNYHYERPLKIKRDHIIGDTIPEENDPPHENEVEVSPNLKTALCRRMSIGSFQKRLKHRNLTLTPKESMQQVLLLQSGDSNSVLLRSTISQKLKVASSENDLNCFSDLTHLDWRYSPFPIQMPIVGYSFSAYNFESPHLRQLQAENLKNENNDENNSRSNFAVQCYKGGLGEPVSEQVNEFNMKNYSALCSSLKSCPSVIVEESDETQSNFTAGHENPLEKKEKEATKTVKSEEQIKLFKDSDTNKVQSKEYESIFNTELSSTTDYTASLDVLVGLLDEIQNITTCQSQIANADADDTEAQFEDMEAIFQSTAALDHVQQVARNIISISSLDKLRQLESNASILSFYLSNNSCIDNIDNRYANVNMGPLYADKEVSAVLPREFDNKCTNVPSRLFPLTVSHSTNVSSSLLGVLSQPSSHSLLTYSEHPLQSVTSLTSLKNLNLMKFPKKRKQNEVDNMPIVVFKHGQLRENHNRKVQNKKVASLQTKQKFVICKKSLKVDSDFDPVMKMKRDILVTMYSVLVFTVFAALSFPEILYRA